MSLGINCPSCGSEKTTVINTKESEYLGLECTMRYRKCNGCRFNFKTMELIESDFLNAIGVTESELDYRINENLNSIIEKSLDKVITERVNKTISNRLKTLFDAW